MKVLFYPDKPVQLTGHTLSKTIRYFQLTGNRITNDINTDWDVAVFWDYRDINITPEILRNDLRPVLNRRLNNVTKSFVDKVFTQVFGYSSLANLSSQGYCVQKSERQSAHDGKFIKLPTERKPGYIYQKLIDNRMSIDMVYDIRLPVFFGEIPIVYLKSRSIEGTFENTLSTKRNYWIDNTNNYMSIEEIKLIAEFSKQFGLDVGEIDCLRDNSTGRLYITDVNNIPGAGVFLHLTDSEKIEQKLANYFINLLKLKYDSCLC